MPDTPRPRLSERDRRVLEFEEKWWQLPGPKDRAIKEYLGMSATRYYQILRRLAEDPVALAEYPMVVRRLQRTRSQARLRAAERALERDRPGP